MTLKQGQDINKQFSLLKDSLSANKLAIENSKKEIIDLNRVYTDSLFKVRKEIFALQQENQFLSEDYKRVKDQVWSDRRERKFTVSGLVMTVLAWGAIFIFAK